MEATSKNTYTNESQVNSTDWKTDDVVSGEWNKLYKIDKNTPLFFKLMDNSILTKTIRDKVKADEFLQKQYAEQLAFIERQRITDLWLKVDERIIKMNLLDLYNTFVCYLKDKSYEDQLFNVNEVSFMGPLGPWNSLPLIQCLNETLINKFIFAGLVNNKIPTRNMRVHTEGNIVINYGQGLELISELQVKQITDSGILFSSKDELVIDEMSKSEMIKFHLNTEHIMRFVENNFKSDVAVKEMFYTEDELRYFYVEESKIQKSLSYRSDETNEFFLFIRYHDMLESDVPNVFMQFMEKLKDYFHFLAR